MDVDEHVIEESKIKKAENSQSLADQLPHNPHIPLWHLPPLDLFEAPLLRILSNRANSPQSQTWILSFDIALIKLPISNHHQMSGKEC